MPCSPIRPYSVAFIASSPLYPYVIAGKAKHEIDEKTQTLLNDAYRHAAEYLRRAFMIKVWPLITMCTSIVEPKLRSLKVFNKGVVEPFGSLCGVGITHSLRISFLSAFGKPAVIVRAGGTCKFLSVQETRAGTTPVSPGDDWPPSPDCQ